MIKVDNCPLCLTKLNADHPLFYYGRGSVGVDVQRTRFLSKNFDFNKKSLDYEKINPASVPSKNLVMQKDIVVSVTVDGAEFIQKVCPNCGSFLNRYFGQVKLNRYCVVSAQSDLPLLYLFNTWEELDEAKPDGWACVTELSECYPKPREGRGHLIMESRREARSILAVEVGSDASLDAARLKNLQITMASGLVVVQSFELLKSRDGERGFFDLIENIADKCTVGGSKKVKIPVALVLVKERLNILHNEAGARERLIDEIRELSRRSVEKIETSIARFEVFEATNKFRNHEGEALIWMMGWNGKD